MFQAKHDSWWKGFSHSPLSQQDRHYLLYFLKQVAAGLCPPSFTVVHNILPLPILQIMNFQMVSLYQSKTICEGIWTRLGIFTSGRLLEDFWNAYPLACFKTYSFGSVFIGFLFRLCHFDPFCFCHRLSPWYHFSLLFASFNISLRVTGSMVF